MDLFDGIMRGIDVGKEVPVGKYEKHIGYLRVLFATCLKKFRHGF